MKKLFVFFIFMLLSIAYLGTSASAQNSLVVSGADFLMVEEDREYIPQGLEQGTLRARVFINNGLETEQNLSLLFCTKDVNGKLISLETKSVRVPFSHQTYIYSIDVEVADPATEVVWLYVWDTANLKPYMEQKAFSGYEINTHDLSALVTDGEDNNEKLSGIKSDETLLIDGIQYSIAHNTKWYINKKSIENFMNGMGSDEILIKALFENPYGKITLKTEEGSNVLKEIRILYQVAKKPMYLYRDILVFEDGSGIDFSRTDELSLTVTINGISSSVGQIRSGDDLKIIYDLTALNFESSKFYDIVIARENENDGYPVSGIVKVNAEVANNQRSALYLQGQVALRILSVKGNTEEIKVGREIRCFLGNTDIDKQLGMKVNALISTGEDYTVVGYTMDPSMQIVEIDSELIKGIYRSGEGFFIRYLLDIKKSEMEEADISSNAKVFVNDTQVPIDELEWLLTYADIIRLVSINDIDLFDRVLITQYEFHGVKSVDVENQTIRTVSNYTLDFSYLDTVYNIYKNGQPITLAQLNQYDVLNIITSPDGLDYSPYIDIYVTDQKVTGLITEIQGYSGQGNRTRYIVRINEKDYRWKGRRPPQIADYGIFLLNINGDIIDMVYPGVLENTNFGLITAWDTETIFGESTYFVRIFNQDGETKIHSLANNILLKSYDSEGFSTTQIMSGNEKGLLLEDLMPRSSGDYSVGKCMVLYKLNIYNEISEITISKETLIPDIFNRVEMQQASISGNRLGSFKVTPSTVLFYAPLYEDGRVNESKLAIIDFYSLDPDTIYPVNIYATNENRNLGIGMIHGDLGFLGQNNGLAVVQSRGIGLNWNGNITTILTIVQSGETKTIPLSPDVVIISGDSGEATFGGMTVSENFFGKGDIILYTLDNKGEAVEIYAIYDASQRKISDQLVASDGKISDRYSIAFGVVTAVGGDLTLSNRRLNPDHDMYFDFDKRENSTIALFDENKTSSSSGFITSYRDFGSLRASSNVESNTRRYLAVVKSEKFSVTDAVEIAISNIESERTISGLTFVGFGFQPNYPESE